MRKDNRARSASGTPFRALAAIFGCVLFATLAGAAWQPDRNVEIIVNTSAGTGSDSTARAIHRMLVENKLIDATAAVVNKPGGGGAIGLAYLTQHKGNGHYLMVTSPTMLTNHITGKSQLNYTDTTPLAQMGSESVVFTVRAESPIKSARELADRVKADPGSLSIAIGNSVGSHNHIAAALLAKAVGADVKRLKVVAFNGSTEGITALLGGHLDLVASPASGVLQLVQGGKARILAVASEKRLAGALAGIPTCKELGLPVIAANWRSIVGPGGLSAQQVRYWDDVFARVSRLPEWKRGLEAKLEEDTYLNAADTKKYMEAQYQELGNLLSDLGLAKQ
jgi:putative tricarboxylic transport membrane protein